MSRMPFAAPETVDINALLGQMKDRRRDSLYDRLQLKAGTRMPAQLRFFQVPVGQPDAYNPVHVRGYNDTNMWTAGSLPAPHEFIVQRFLMLFQPWMNPGDRDALLGAYHWQFQVLSKIIARQPGIVGSAEGKPDDLLENFGQGTWLNNDGDRRNDSTSVLHRVAPGIAWEASEACARFIPALAWFGVELSGEPFRLQSDLDMYVMLDGMRDCEVQ